MIDKNSYQHFIGSWSWEWYVTFTFPPYPYFSRERIRSMLKRWSRKLSKSEHMQVGYVYALVYKNGHPHLHLLMISSSKNNKTLAAVDTDTWENEWNYIVKIEIPYSNVGVSIYLVKNMLSIDGDFDFYNVKLLKKLKWH